MKEKIIALMLFMFSPLIMAQSLTKLKENIDGVYGGKWKPSKEFYLSNASGDSKTYQSIIDGFAITVLYSSKDREIWIEKTFSVGDISSVENDKRLLFQYVFQPISAKYNLPITSIKSESSRETPNRGCVEKMYGSGEGFEVKTPKVIQQRNVDVWIDLSTYYGKTGRCASWADNEHKSAYEDMPARVNLNLKIWPKN